jgi:glycosyl transferase family 92
MYYLTACLIFRDAASYLDEWLRFHLLVGVEHFYLYDNDSSDDYLPVIRPFCTGGKVTLTRWPGAFQQTNVYTHCLQRHSHSTRWMAYLDDDEFLFPAQAGTLPDALAAYESYAGVAACWLLFGSDGHRTRPPGFVTRSYRRRGGWVDQHVKCIVNPVKVSGPAVLAHSFHCLPGEVIVDENYQPIVGPFSCAPSANVFCLNHYLIKSHDEMVSRRTRRRADGPDGAHSIEQWELFDSSYNAVEDLRIQRFAVELDNHAILGSKNPIFQTPNQAMQRTAD